MIPIYSGFESTRIISPNQDFNYPLDVLQTTEHFQRYTKDLSLVKSLGIGKLRVSFPWHIIEYEPGHFNWTWMDAYVKECDNLGIGIIADPLHHISFPKWLDKGFLNPEFPSSYYRFFIEVVSRYPSIKDYTIINEPLVTALFSCEVGTWFPFERNKLDLALENIKDVFSKCSSLLQLRGKRHIYVEATEYHYGTCDSSYNHAREKNEWRFSLIDDLLQQGVIIDVLGLDYYAHSEFEWCSEGRRETTNPSGFYTIAMEYYNRYKIPIALTETNIRGYITDRQTWFKHMYLQCLQLSKEIPFEFMLWYPFIDSTDWDSLLTQYNRNIDPVGIIWLDSNFDRHTSEFSDVIAKLNYGTLDIEHVKEYNYLPPLDSHLKGFNEVFKKVV